MEAKIISTTRGCNKLCVEGFMYTKKHAGKKQITWKCVLRTSQKCPGCIKTDLNMKNPTEGTNHNHPGSVEKVSAVEARQTMKRKAETTLDKPNHILSGVVENLPDEVNAQLQPNETCRRNLWRIRAKNRPKKPSSLDQLNLTGEWTKTSGPEPKQFLLFDNGNEAAERLIIFSTEEAMQLLGRSRSWFMDGTFGVAPHLFTQLYVIHGEVGNSRRPLLYALMQRQMQSSFEELFNVIVDKCNADPSTIVVDFEKAVHQAIINVFGNEVNIHGCFYHLTQSTWRKIQNLGLSDSYKNDDNIRLFCGQLDALAFLPIDKVKEGMEYLKKNCPPGAEDLVEYFDKHRYLDNFDVVKLAEIV